MLAVDRGLVDLEVAGVQDDAERCVDRQRNAVRHAVRHADELDLEWPDGDALAWPHRLGRRVLQPVFLQLLFDHRQRQRRTDDRPGNVGHHVRHRADVVLMAVRQHERGGAPFLLQIGEVRDDPVNTQQFGVRKHDAGIDHDGCLTPGEGQHVHAEFAETAERNDFEHS